MPVSERAPAGNDITIWVVTHSLELPHPVNQLQVSYMLTLVCKDELNVIVEPVEYQFVHGISSS